MNPEDILVSWQLYEVLKTAKNCALWQLNFICFLRARRQSMSLLCGTIEGIIFDMN